MCVSSTAESCSKQTKRPLSVPPVRNESRAFVLWAARVRLHGLWLHGCCVCFLVFTFVCLFHYENAVLRWFCIFASLMIASYWALAILR